MLIYITTNDIIINIMFAIAADRTSHNGGKACKSTILSLTFGRPTIKQLKDTRAKQKLQFHALDTDCTVCNSAEIT